MFLPTHAHTHYTHTQVVVYKLYVVIYSTSRNTYKRDTVCVCAYSTHTAHTAHGLREQSSSGSMSSRIHLKEMQTRRNGRGAQRVWGGGGHLWSDRY